MWRSACSAVSFARFVAIHRVDVRRACMLSALRLFPGSCVGGAEMEYTDPLTPVSYWVEGNPVEL